MPKRRKIEVEDHGNGFMVIGTPFPAVAIKVLRDYVESVRPYRIAAVVHYQGRSAVWLTTEHGEFWEGARSHIGEPLARSGA